MSEQPIPARVHLDSTGQFTMNVEASQRKQKFQESALFMLKAVQAAVTMGAPEVQFHVGRELVSCTFTPTRQEFDVAAVAESAELVQLFHCVQSALSLAPQSVTLSAQEQQSVWRDRQRNSTHIAARTGLTLAVQFPAAGFFASLFSSTQTLHLRDQLAQHCSLCPIPVLLDGKLLNQLAPEKLRDLQSKTAQMDLMERTWAYTGYYWLGEVSFLTARESCFCVSAPLIRKPFRMAAQGVPQVFDLHYPNKSGCPGELRDRMRQKPHLLFHRESVSTHSRPWSRFAGFGAHPGLP